MSYGSPTSGEPTYTASVNLTSPGRYFTVTYEGNIDFQTVPERDDDFQEFLDFLATYPGSTVGGFKTYPSQEAVSVTP
jgi:hypothetical protein